MRSLRQVKNRICSIFHNTFFIFKYYFPAFYLFTVLIQIYKIVFLLVEFNSVSRVDSVVEDSLEVCSKTNQLAKNLKKN